MAAVSEITTYQELQDHIADTLIRTDLTTPITTFIQLAEASFKRDKRVRKLQTREFSLSADGNSLPSDFHSLESWYHDGPTYFGQIEIVNSDMIGWLKANRFGGAQLGPPFHAALVAGTVRFAPAPADTYATKMTYWRKIAALSDTNTSNWLLADHPDIYVYGTLVHTAPYLKDDNRLQIWQTLLTSALGELDQATEDEMFSGSMRRNFQPIGG